jgi:hypothetical protein
MPAGITFIFGQFIEGYWNSTQQRAREYKGMSMTLWWSPTRAPDEMNVIEEIALLEEREDGVYTFFVRPENNQEKAVFAISDSLQEFKLRYGSYLYTCKFKKPIPGPGDKEYSQAILISNFPSETFMMDVPGQFMLEGGVFFHMPAAKLNLVYVNQFTMVNDDYLVLVVGFDPGKVFALQNKLGLLSSDTDKGVVEKGAQLAINNEAMKHAIRAREAEGQLTAYIESYMDSRARGIASSGKYLDNSDFIRKKHSRFDQLREKINWKVALALGLLVLLIAYRMRARALPFL